MKEDNRLTLEQFKEFPDGDIFATGELPNSPEGLFMTRAGGQLRWVAVKGYANDWTIYCHWVDNSVEWIKDHGDKLHNPDHIKLCVPCTDEVYNRYRF